MPSPGDFILTKILATIGPACQTPQLLIRMIEEGMRVARINFSHGTFDDFEKSLAAVREASRCTRIPVGVLGDLSGPKIRLGRVEDPGIELGVGDQVEFTHVDRPSERVADSKTCVLSTNYPRLIDEVHPGQRVLIDDGAIRMLAVERLPGDGDELDKGRLLCRVTQGGLITTRKGVNLPDTELSLPSITNWDRRCARWAIDHQIDYLALSFVRKADDLHALQSLITDYCREKQPVQAHAAPPLIAKIEKPQAIEEIDAICDAADGVMVARGDLGVEMDLAQVPVIQKRIIDVAHAFGKPVIVATQMLQSMIDHASPTRAEVSDVANAIIDGADAVMLSGETAVGRYPVQTVRMMARTASFAEPYVADLRRDAIVAPRRLQESRYRTAALAHGVAAVARDLGARYVVTWSELGGSARYLSQNRLPEPILAVSSNDAALRRMSLMFGVTPVGMQRPGDSERFLHVLDAMLLDRQWAQPGDAVVVAMGQPLGSPGVTNEIRIHYVGDVCRINEPDPGALV